MVAGKWYNCNVAQREDILQRNDTKREQFLFGVTERQWLNGKGAASFEPKSTTHAATQLSLDGPFKVRSALSQIRDSFVQRLKAIDVLWGSLDVTGKIGE